MGNKTLPLLLAGLISTGGVAQAKQPEKKEKPKIVQTAKRSPIIKKLNPTKDEVDMTRYNWPIHRNNLGFNVNYVSHDVNGLEYANGVSFNIDGTINYSLLKWLNLKANLDLNYQSLGLTTENASETLLNTNLSLEARTKLYFSRDLRLWMGVGGDYVGEADKLIYKGIDGYEERHAGGPMLTLGLESRNFDMYLRGSVLFGEKNSSYDRDRKILVQHLNVTLVPRYWRFELPISVDGYHWSINDYLVDRHNFRAILKIEPTFRITPHIAVSLFAKYFYNNGEDLYSLYELGGGFKLLW